MVTFAKQFRRNQSVEVTRDVRRQCWKIVQGGQVVGYATSVRLEDVSFDAHVTRKGRVTAYVRGKIVQEFSRRYRYTHNVNLRDVFMVADEPVERLDAIELSLDRATGFRTW